MRLLIISLCFASNTIFFTDSSNPVDERSLRGRHVSVCLRGPPGLNGRNGNNGPPGLNGRDGRTGRDGPPGKAGRPGSPGRPGPKGTIN